MGLTTIAGILLLATPYIQPLPPFFTKTDYCLNFEKFETVKENPEYMRMLNCKISKYNRTTTVLNGNFEFVKDVTEDLKLDMIGYELHGVEYRRSILDFKNLGYCYHLDVQSPLSSGVLNSMNVTRKGCPIPAGIYNINNFIIEKSFYRSVFVGHKWRMDIILHEKDIIWSHNRIYFSVQN